MWTPLPKYLILSNVSEIINFMHRFEELKSSNTILEVLKRYFVKLSITAWLTCTHKHMLMPSGRGPGPCSGPARPWGIWWWWGETELAEAEWGGHSQRGGGDEGGGDQPQDTATHTQLHQEENEVHMYMCDKVIKAWLTLIFGVYVCVCVFLVITMPVWWVREISCYSRRQRLNTATSRTWTEGRRTTRRCVRERERERERLNFSTATGQFSSWEFVLVSEGSVCISSWRRGRAKPGHTHFPVDHSTRCLPQSWRWLPLSAHCLHKEAVSGETIN